MDKKKGSSELQDEGALRLWDGDETVLAEILVNYAPSIIKALTNRYRASSLTYQDVEDAVCEAIKRLWAKREDYDESKGSVRALLYTIANRVCLDVLRSGWSKFQSRIRSYEDVSLEKMTSTEEDGDHNEKSPAYKKMLNDLKEIVEGLPDIQKKIIWAYAFAPDGAINASDLSEEYGHPAATIRQYLKRAKDKMKSEMKKRGYQL